MFGEEFTLGSSSKQFHKDCFIVYLESCIQERNLPIRFPDENCYQLLDEKDIFAHISMKCKIKYRHYIYIALIEKNKEDIHFCPNASCQTYAWKKDFEG